MGQRGSVGALSHMVPPLYVELLVTSCIHPLDSKSDLAKPQWKSFYTLSLAL